MEIQKPKPKLKAVRSKVTPIDSELTNIRLEGRWEALDSLQKSKSKLSDSGKFLDLAYLERIVEDASAAREAGGSVSASDPVSPELQKALDGLRAMISSSGEEYMDWFLLESKLLLGKLLWALGREEEALSHFHSFLSADLCPEPGWPVHALRLLAECSSQRGLALTRLLMKTEQWRDNAGVVLQNQQLAMTAALLYFQELSLQGSTPASPSKPVNAASVKVTPQLEAAVHYAPLLHLVLGDATTAVQLLRSVLRLKENGFTKAIRLCAARQLALLLLRAPQSFSLPVVSPDSPLTLCSHPVLSRADFLLPGHRAEEIVLALVVAEGLVRRDAVQSRFPNDRSAYDKWHDQVTAVYDLAVLVLGSLGRPRLAELLEESMRFSFDDEHMWMQFGLALISSGKYERAVVVLKQCLQQYPDNQQAALLICKLYINHLPDADEAIAYASKLTQTHTDLAQSHFALGLGYAARARKTITESERQDSLVKSVEALEEAHRLDPSDPESALYYALQLAVQHRTSDAMVPVMEILEKNPVHHHALWLLILLQTCLKSYSEALAVCNQALIEYPNDLAFALLKVEIEATFSDVSHALVSARAILPRDEDVKEVCAWSQKHMWLALTHLFLLNEQFEDAASSFKKIDDSSFSLHPQMLYFRGRLLAHDKKVEQARMAYLGAIAADPNHVACLLALSDLHLAGDNPTMAEQYISQALAVDPGSYSAWHRLGCVLQQQGEQERAAECFVNALQIESLAPISPLSDVPLTM